MKNFFKALGKAILYFLVYFGWQMIVAVGFGIVLSVRYSMELMASGKEVEQNVMVETLNAQISENAMLMTFLAGALAILTYWIVFLIRKKKLSQEVAICKMPVKGIAAMLLLGLSFNVVISVVLSYVPFPQSWMDSYEVNAGVLVQGNMFISWITTVIMAPVLEEIVFRGLMYTRLKKGMPVVLATIITSLAFACMHGTMIWGIYTFIFSVLLIFVFERYHSLLANMMLHVGFNVTGMGLQEITKGMSDAAGWVLFAVSVIIFVGGLFLTIRMTKKTQQEIPVYAE